ncbi:MAG: hypothetical protein P0S94_01805 [Simkaniaceae bacterium]|nr:hypothetical protein [Simkaniaceae bacterium]
MSRPQSTNIIHGLVSGLIAGIVFAFMLAEMGMLSVIGKIIGLPYPTAGLILHLCFSIIIGIFFALIFQKAVRGVWTGLVLGIPYGAIWWAIGPLTLMPLFLGLPTNWHPAAIATTMPTLAAHLVYGLVLGVVYSWLTRGYHKKHEN